MTQETDQELLEWAAKAAGFDVHGFFGDDETGEWWADVGEEEVIEWNPLTDDGDALRLAVKLRLDLIFGYKQVGATGEIGTPDFIERYGSDKNSATRRAIVRAAADIGKAM